MQKEYGDLKVQLSKQMMNDTGKSGQKDLNEFKDNILRQIELKFKEINEKVEVRLGEGFPEKRIKHLQMSLKDLRKLMKHKRKIETLSTEVISLNDLLKGQKTRGIFGEVAALSIFFQQF